MRARLRRRHELSDKDASVRWRSAGSTGGNNLEPVSKALQVADDGHRRARGSNGRPLAALHSLVIDGEARWIEPAVAMRRLEHRLILRLSIAQPRYELLGGYSYPACKPFCTYMVAGGGAVATEMLSRTIHGAFFAACSPSTGASIDRFASVPEMPTGFFACHLNRTSERLADPGNRPSALVSIDPAHL